MIEILLIILYILLGALALIIILPALFFAFAYALSLFVNTEKEHKDNAFFRFIMSALSFIIIRFARIKIRLSGEEKLPEEQKYLLVCNHRSGFDPIVTLCALRKQKLGVVSKKENFKLPVFGGIGAMCSFVSIDRQNPKSSLKSIIRAAQLIQNGINMCVYPEGTRSYGTELLPFHDAIFKIATKAKCPIVICSVSGTENVAKRAPFKRTDVYLDILEVIPAEQVAAMRTCEIGEYTKNAISQNLKIRDE